MKIIMYVHTISYFEAETQSSDTVEITVGFGQFVHSFIL
jgi:hypothetical protein